MAVLARVRLYFDTLRHLKASQVVYRLWRRMGGSTPIRFGHRVQADINRTSIARVPVLPELDFDSVFLGRFDVEALRDNRVTLLHHEERIDWASSWKEDVSTPLWRFNLHYGEYLLPLAYAAKKSLDDVYLEKAKAIVDAWITGNPRAAGGVGWNPYVVSMRVTNWLAFYGETVELLSKDAAFIARMNLSLAQQYDHLSRHLEKDILANHYLENLKALVLLSCYFGDEATLDYVLPLLKEQIDEQVLSDGMHFELSPMYHKLMLESLMRVGAALRANGRVDKPAQWCRLQDMCDCLYSLERGVDRTPLFNDSGDNVAKSRDALLICARAHFAVRPKFKSIFPDAGYYIMEKEVRGASVKVILDAGNPGPGYAAAHAHCDLLSFEVYVNGNPWLVNTGTFAYQDARRLAFKRTDAHNAPRYADGEQSECWAPFRMARMARAVSAQRQGDRIEAVMLDCRGRRISRRLELRDDELEVCDMVDEGARVVSVVHAAEPCPTECFKDGRLDPYAPDFGCLEQSRTLVFEGLGSVVYRIPLPCEVRDGVEIERGR
jgi:hypothetical protein